MRFKFLVLLLMIGLTALMVGSSPALANHQGRFTEYKGSSTCLPCHAKEVNEVFGSVHYQWQGDARYAEGLSTDKAGKLGGINDFCIYPDINFIGRQPHPSGGTVNGGCAQCHVGMGAKPSTTPTSEQLANIDCLICHSDKYQRKVVDVNGQWRFAPDEAAMSVSLMDAAWNLSKPTTLACLKCHAKGGGGDNFKRGDMALAQANATPDLDIHLASQASGGAGLNCLSCHKSQAHRIPGRGSDLRPIDTTTKIDCADCHTNAPHDDSQLNTHVNRVHCTVCHIPTFAKGTPTDLHRDYSVPADTAASGLYEPHMQMVSNIIPVYKFWNRSSYFYEFGQPASPGSEGRVVMSEPVGSLNITGSRLFPFKLHQAEQPQDPATNRLIPLKMSVYFGTGDVIEAAKQGVAAVGWSYQGQNYASTLRYMGLFHQVAPKSQALNCADCHGGTRVDFAALGYTPLSTRNGKPLCSSCHGRENNLSFTAVHRQHVDGERLDCSSCHTFSKAGAVTYPDPVNPGPTPVEGTIPMYRAYNPYLGYHFFTTNQSEYNHAVAAGYQAESGSNGAFRVYQAQQSGTSAIFRLYNPNSGFHYYTTKASERDSLVSLGWRYERREGYIYPQSHSGAQEVYRLYNTQTGAHLYTLKKSERDWVLANLHQWKQNSSLGWVPI
ncbi:MAG: hypothetical protein KQJ78_10460 [Deltaproteobacteria bacterium]|nr:hypothetical protein [Deltaproteobacteria bacterium]